MITVVPDNPNRPLSDKCQERIQRLKQESIRFMPDLIKQCEQIDQIIDSGDYSKIPFVLEDPIEADMTQYSGDGIIKGSNVNQFHNQPIKYSDMPQNSITTPVYKANVVDMSREYGGYYMSKPMMYNSAQFTQPRYNQQQFYQGTNLNTTSNMVNTTPWYNSPQNFTPQYGNETQQSMYYRPMNYNTNPNFTYNNNPAYQEYFEEIEEQRRKQIQTQAFLMKFFHRVGNVDNPAYTDEEDEKYCRNVDRSFGIGTDSKAESLYIRINAKVQEYIRKKREQYKQDILLRGHEYDEDGIRREKVTLRTGITVNGVYYPMSPKNGPEGYRIVEYTRRDDEIIRRNHDHFYDIYIRMNELRTKFYKAVEQVKKITGDKYHKYSYEELMYDGHMKDYYYETVVKEDSQKIMSKLRGVEWDRERFDMLLDADTGYRGMSTAFYPSYEDAKFFHAMNLSKTPEELELDKDIKNRLKTEYDKRREIFVGRVKRRNVRCDMSVGARQREVISHDNILDMSLDQLMEGIETPSETSVEKHVEVINNPMSICGIPVSKRTIETGVLTDEELEYERNKPAMQEDYFDSNGNLISSVSNYPNPQSTRKKRISQEILDSLDSHLTEDDISQF